MLKVYAAQWCPHCQRTVKFLKNAGVPFEYIDMDKASTELEKKLDAVNGGTWVVPTLEYNGQWRPGEAFNESALKSDLLKWGIRV